MTRPTTELAGHKAISSHVFLVAVASMHGEETIAMDNQSFDMLTRKAAGGVSRRTSLMTLSAAGLTALLAAPFTTEARKNGKKKKKNQASPQPPPPVDLCASQVAPCTTFLTAACGTGPTCPNQIQCCNLLGTCDASGFFSCLIAAQTAQ